MDSKQTKLFSDINECLTNNGGCAQNCANTNGSFVCSCNIGYTLNADNRTCAGRYASERIYAYFHKTHRKFICTQIKLPVQSTMAIVRKFALAHWEAQCVPA